MTKKFDFGRAYKELEEIVSEFESRDIDLEKDLPKFERGMELAVQLQKHLKVMENTVIDIEKKAQGGEK